MPVIMIDSAKSDSLSAKETIRRHFCPKSTIADIENALCRIKAQAVPKKLPEMKIDEFVCKNKRCGGTKLYVPPSEYPTHKTCLRCGLVYGVMHQGQAYRNFKEEADRNTNGTKDNLMSAEYNSSEITTMKRLHNYTSRDTHIMDARANFDNISAKLHFNSTPNKALNLYCSFLDGIVVVKDDKEYYTVKNADTVYAACMFHCLTVPKVFPFKKSRKSRKTRKHVSKKKRRVAHKRPYTKSRASMLT